MKTWFQFYKYISRQLTNLWGLTPRETKLLRSSLPDCVSRLDDCISTYRKPSCLNPLHAGQQVILTQYLRQALSLSERGKYLAEKLYLLARAIYSVDLYSAALPAHIYFEHPLGTVIGRAKLGDFLTILQGVTIGGSTRKDGNLYNPQIGNNIIFYSDSAVIGKSSIGGFNILASGCRVINEDVPSHSIVFGTSPNLVIKPLSIDRYAQLAPFLISEISIASTTPNKLIT